MEAAEKYLRPDTYQELLHELRHQYSKKYGVNLDDSLLYIIIRINELEFGMHEYMQKLDSNVSASLQENTKNNKNYIEHFESTQKAIIESLKLSNERILMLKNVPELTTERKAFAFSLGKHIYLIIFIILQIISLIIICTK